MKKAIISNFLRNLRLIFVADVFRFYLMRYRNKRANREFKLQNPDVKLPPDYLIYESFQIDYKKYYTESIESAVSLKKTFSKYVRLENLKILDCGCGPGRIIRHFPKIIGKGCEFYATDYNEKSIKWCAENLPGIKFNKNTLFAKLKYPDQYFDIIYGLSIITHLSEEMHYNWYNELYRILKPGGILYLTSQGENYRIKLTNFEKQKFEKGKVVVRGKVKEGHRTYSAFQPKEFMKKLLRNVVILDHVAEKSIIGKWIPQDIWIAKKIHS